MSKYLTAPVKSTSLPRGIPYIIGNEAAERFSFYGMKAILVVFMTKYLMGDDGVAPMSQEEAKTWYHLFGSAVYFTPILGAIVADVFFGKYKTIISLSIVYCLGHLALALDESRLGLSIGLTLIAIGAGGIKPCVSAHVGDQFGKTNASLLDKVFGWFYFSINLGAFASQMLTPLLLDRFGPQVAFGLPGGLMLLATIVFWMGRNVFIHIPPGGQTFVREAFSREGLGILLRLGVIYLFVAMFWALFDQTGSAWVLQADRMDRNWLGMEWLPSQIGAINPILIMVFIPIFSFWVYPAIDRVFPLTPIRKISLGFFVAVPSFLIPAWIELQIAAGELPSILWQLLAYAFITAAEVFISITCLEFSYTQAPRSMKSLVLGLFLMSVSLGNLFTAGVNHFILNQPPALTPDVAGRYVLELTASDGVSEASSRVEIQVRPEDVAKEVEPTDGEELTKKKPEADAGNWVAVRPGSSVRLYGTAAKGDYRGPFTYRWNFEKVPQQSRVTDENLAGADTRNPSFKPDEAGDYELRFTVTVGDSPESTNRVKVVVTNSNLPPVVDAGGPMESVLNETVELDGSSTFDPERAQLTYQWRIVTKPAGSKLGDSDLLGSTFPAQTSRLQGANYYFFFAGMMLLAACLFIPVAMRYKPKAYLQEESA